MNTRYEAPGSDDAVHSFGEPEEPVAAWSLDELDQLSELESVRSAWGQSNGLDV